VNGDGVVNDGDIDAFVAGWLYMQEIGDINSLRKGDLNQDGTTNLFDWQILRVNHPNGPSLNLGSFLNVPEPVTGVLAFVGYVATMVAGRADSHRRRRYGKPLFCIDINKG
jgi:hypothetical protein